MMPSRGDPAGRSTRLGPDFDRLWASTAASNLGDGILVAGLPVLATSVTRSPTLVAAIQVALLVPMALSALPSGAVVDRRDRARLVALANLVRAIGMAVVIVVASWGGWILAAVYAAAVLTGSLETVSDAAVQAAVPSTVRDRDLPAANSRMAATLTVLNDAVGAPIGGLLAAASLAWALGVPAALFGVAALAVRRLHLPAIPVRPSGSDRTGTSLTTTDMPTAIRDGIGFVWSHPVLRRMAVANMANNLGNTAFFAVAILVFIGPLGLPPAGFGLFLALLAVGGVIGTAFSTRLVEGLGPRRVFVVGPIVSAFTYGLIFLTVDPWTSAAATLVFGAFGVSWMVATRVVRQRLTPDDLLGRTTATMRLISLAATPIGAVLAGVVAEFAGLRMVGWVTTGAFLLAWLAVRRIPVDALSPPHGASHPDAAPPLGDEADDPHGAGPVRD